MRPAPRAGWLPPFVLGASGAVAGEVAAGLLLYSGNGFVRALTLILATLLGALALGLWSAPPPGMPRPVESLRRRWLLVLVTFVLATATAAGWTALGGLMSQPVSRGIGLAFLAAAPLYATGALLGTMASIRTDLGRRGPGGAAAAGAAVGVVLTGMFLTRVAAPFSMHVLAIVALSAAALVHGRELDRALPADGGAGTPEGDAAAPPLSAGPPDPEVPTGTGGAGEPAP